MSLIKSYFQIILGQITLLAPQNFPEIQKLMFGMIVLRKKIGWEYDKEYDDGPNEMRPGIDGLVVPLEKTFQQWPEIVAYTIASHDSAIELKIRRNIVKTDLFYLFEDLFSCRWHEFDNSNYNGRFIY